jgi:hypothetical protein
MIRKSLVKISAICLAALMTFTPVNATAASFLKKGSSGSEVKIIQTTLKKMGYYSYPRITGYYGSITEKAVRRFQKDNGISVSGKIGKVTRGVLFKEKESTDAAKSGELSLMKTVSYSKAGSFDWFNTVQYIWDRGMDAVVTDVDTGKSFQVRRTFGTNHADVEPITRADAKMIKEIWGGWTWTRRAVLVQVGDYILAGSMSAMPHAGVDDAPAVSVVSGRSGGYGRGNNLDEVKNNGVNGVMDLHFLNSRNHNTNLVKKAHQDMVKKAASYIKKLDL